MKRILMVGAVVLTTVSAGEAATVIYGNGGNTATSIEGLVVGDHIYDVEFTLGSYNGLFAGVFYSEEFSYEVVEAITPILNAEGATTSEARFMLPYSYSETGMDDIKLAIGTNYPWDNYVGWINGGQVPPGYIKQGNWYFPSTATGNFSLLTASEPPPGCVASNYTPKKCDPYNPNLNATPLDDTASPSPVPLPAALPLLAASLGGLGFIGRRKKKAA